MFSEGIHKHFHYDSRGPVLGANETREFIIGSLGATRKGGGRNGNDTRVASTVRCNQYGDDHWKWHVSGGPVLGANETREFIIRSLGATRKGGGRNGNDTRVASTARCNRGELS